MRCVIGALALVAACGPAPIEAALVRDGHHDPRRVADGELVVLSTGHTLLVAPRGCDETSCTTVLDANDDAGGATVEPFAPGWFLVRRAWSSHTWHGDGNGEIATAVQLGSPPRLGCPVALSSYGCNSEWGYCTTTTVELLPGGDGASFTARTSRVGGRDESIGTRIECTRYALDARGACQISPVACP